MLSKTDYDFAVKEAQKYKEIGNGFFKNQEYKKACQQYKLVSSVKLNYWKETV